LVNKLSLNVFELVNPYWEAFAMFHWFLRSMAMLTLVLLVACGGSVAGVSDPVDGGGGGDVGGGDGGGDDNGDDDGGGGPTPVPTALFTTSQEEDDFFFDVMRPERSRIGNGLPNLEDRINFIELGGSGGTVYAGYMSVGGGLLAADGLTVVADINALGLIELEVPFGNLGIAGTATDFIGQGADEYGSQRLIAYNGVIDVTGGSVFQDPSGSAAVEMTISGSLDSGLNEFHFEGSLEGFLYDSSNGRLHARGIQPNGTTAGSLTVFEVDNLIGQFGSAIIWAEAAGTNLP
jgi:hypothetical protein